MEEGKDKDASKYRDEVSVKGLVCVDFGMALSDWEVEGHPLLCPAHIQKGPKLHPNSS